MSPPQEEYDQWKPGNGKEDIEAACRPRKPQGPFSRNEGGNNNWNQNDWEGNTNNTNTWNQGNSYGGHKNTWDQSGWKNNHQNQNTWNQGR